MSAQRRESSKGKRGTLSRIDGQRYGYEGGKMSEFRKGDGPVLETRVAGAEAS